MRKGSFTQKLFVVSLVYWVLLTYMVAALVWWFIALEKQNKQITQIRLSELVATDYHYAEKSLEILAANKRKTAQYIGEGVTFLALIVIGAIFVYRAARRQLKLSQQQQNFMMAITHELKTPIAVTQLNLETLQKRKLDEAQQKKLILNTLFEANRLNVLCNNILLASQLDAGAYHTTNSEINFSDLVGGVIDEFHLRYPSIQIQENIPAGVYLMGEPLLLQLLLNNLLDNARKYSEKGSPIEVTIREEVSQIVLKIMNFGETIPASEKKKIFEKFYRSGNENTRNSKGTGLGLYLCKKIMEKHEGVIYVLDQLPSGSIFVAEFKK